MSVPDQETAFFYTANGVTTTFAYGFYLLSLDDIQVSLDGVVQTSGFTVNGIGSQTGGAVIFSSAPDSGVTVLIERAVAIERESDFQPNGDLRSDVLNNEFDRIWMALQDKKRENVRSLRYPTFEDLDGLLPPASSRANMLLGFSATGIHTLIPLPSSIGAGDIVPNTFTSGVDFTPDVTTQLTLSRAPGGNGNLEVFFDGIFQGFDQWNVSGTTLTFTSPIPTGVGKVFVRIGTTLSTEIPPDQSVTDEKVATGTKLYTRITDLPFITDGNLVLGDGSTDDAAGMLARFNAENGRAIIFPARTYFLGSDVNAPAGSQAYFQSGVSFAGTGKLKNVLIEYEQANATAVIGSSMKIDRLQEHAIEGYKAKDLAYLWGEKTYAFSGFSKTFGASDGGTQAPCTTTVSYAVNNGCPGEVVGHLMIGRAITNNGTAFGANIIDTCDLVTNAKLFGLEIDHEPAAGATVQAISTALNIVGFNVSGLGTGIVLGGVSGGKFNAGLSFLDSITPSGVAIATQAGLSCSSFMDLSAGVYSTAGIVFGNGQQQQLYFKTSGGSQAAGLYADTGGNLVAQLNAAAMLINGPTTIEGNALLAVRDSGGAAAMQVFIARSAAPNAAATAMKLQANTVTSRSLNATGTLNASGADYAEYEYLRGDCAPIVKGQIVGFDADGKLTDKFSQSITFAVKSTAPNLVGGDNWSAPAGERPEPPLAPGVPLEPVLTPTIRAEQQDAAEAEYQQKLAQYKADLAAYETAMSRYRTDFDAYQILLRAWEATFEALRQQVDRIAYCGKVPVNVTGAAVGQHVVPVAGPDDSITAVLIDDEAITFAQYRAAVGRVRRILEDGRAEVVVKPI